MKVIVGLGNPGPEYQRTRHNAGFMVLDRLAARHAPGAVARSRFRGLTVETRLRRAGASGGWGAKPAPGEGAEPEPEVRALLLKPTTYMNRSGGPVGEAVRYYKADPANDLLVVVDDVALPAGEIRLRARGSAGGHNGLADIERALSTPEYARLRVGVDKPGRIPQVDYVLGRFTEEQWERVDPALDRAAEAAAVWATGGAEEAMNRFNVRATPADGGRGDGAGPDGRPGASPGDAGAAEQRDH